MIGRLHYISQEPHLDNIEAACRAGCDFIQLRAKDVSLEAYILLAQQAKQITEAYGAKLIINDNPQVAAAVQAYGVHLGKEDLSVEETRKLIGLDQIIGASTNSLEDILQAAEAKVQYVGLGPLRITQTKTNLNPVLGFDGIATIMEGLRRKNITLPVIVIGGVTVEDVDQLMKLGVHGCAVSAAITVATDQKKLVSAFQKKLIAKN